MTINDLEFNRHSIPGATQAKVTFPNGYGASVITGSMFYTREAEPYEMAVLFNGSLCYSTPITDGILGYLTAEDVTNYLQQIEAL